MDGSGFAVLESNVTPYNADPDFSPDGSKIAYSAYAEAGNWRSAEIYVANADGSDPTPVTSFGAVQYAIEPRFSPDGTKIAFTGTPPGSNSEQIYTVNLDGTDLKRLTNDEYASTPEWAPNGNEIVYQREGESYSPYVVNADGSGEERPFISEAGFTETSEVTFSPSGSTVSADEYLGKTFEPILRFHSTEKWRPLNVSSFMREEDPFNPGHSYNKICVSGSCSDIPPEWEEALRTAANTPGTRYIKMGEWPEEALPYPTSPYGECYANGLWDCDSGPRTAIYYHVLPSATEGRTSELGYNYIDYWIFYRYNQDQNDPLSLDDHQGDWEGLTVAPSISNPSAFDFAIFAQHSGFSVYAPENLTCDQGGTESCGAGGMPRGERVWDFVAVGTHASYPAVDEGGVTGICTQPESPLPDGCHDGKAPWGANYEASDVLPFPPSGSGFWTDWPGTWGDDPGGLLGGTGESPLSPGLQRRFQCPWRPYEADPTACPSTAVTGTAQAREATASTCDNWFGAMVVMTVCSPSELSRAIHTAAMGRHGSLRIVAGKHRRRAASLPGVAQLVGATLHAGERLTVVGNAPADARLFVRAQGHHRVVQAVFDHLGLEHGGRGTIKAVGTASGIYLIWTAPDGRRSMPSESRTSSLPTPRTAGASAEHGASHPSRQTAG